jgi:hypothetical protein
VCGVLRSWGQSTWAVDFQGKDDNAEPHRPAAGNVYAVFDGKLLPVATYSTSISVSPSIALNNASNHLNPYSHKIEITTTAHNKTDTSTDPLGSWTDLTIWVPIQVARGYVKSLFCHYFGSDMTLQLG